jgi:hypothetical protein
VSGSLCGAAQTALIEFKDDRNTGDQTASYPSLAGQEVKS